MGWSLTPGVQRRTCDLAEKRGNFRIKGERGKPDAGETPRSGLEGVEDKSSVAQNFSNKPYHGSGTRRGKRAGARFRGNGTRGGAEYVRNGAEKARRCAEKARRCADLEGEKARGRILWEWGRDNRYQLKHAKEMNKTIPIISVTYPQCSHFNIHLGGSTKTG